MASYSNRRNNFEELNITRDELNQLGEALKKEEFRKLLNDYVEEITDPENQKLYESEITQLEKERGVDVTFIHPIPGYVIKTSVDGKKKAFINVCQNDKIGQPISSPQSGGVNWRIPYSQAPPREDVDKKKNLCLVYDVVFHPDTIQMTKTNNKFKEFVSDTALNAVEESFKVVLDKKNIRYPKMIFKGMKQPTVIRKKSKCPPSPQSEDSDQGIFEIPNYPYSMPPEETVPKVSKMPMENKVEKSSYTTPKYIIKQRNNIEFQEFTNSITSKMNAAIPSELVVEIELPLLKSARDVSLDVSEKALSLVSVKPAKYKLDITLPYSIIEDAGSAKFDSRTKKLVVTLVVRRQNKVRLYPELNREDSGVDSDAGSGNRSLESSCSEDEPAKSYPNGSVNEGLSLEHSSREDVALKNQPDVCETYRTKNAQFLRSEIHYILPSFTCNVLENMLAFTFHVRNVEPSSVEHQYLVQNSGFQVKFTSIGSGFFPSHHVFCVKFPNQVFIESDSLSIEVWDNNVIAQVNLVACDIETVTEYWYGKDEKSLENKVLDEPGAVFKYSEKAKAIEDEQEDSSEVSIIESNKDNVVLEIVTSKNEIYPVQEMAELEKEEEEETEEHQEVKPDLVLPTSAESAPIGKDSTGASAPIRYGKKKKSLSFDDNESFSGRLKMHTLSGSLNEKNEKKPHHRGILKVGRSLSESSVDDYHWSSLSVDNVEHNGSVEKTKKTVRFSDSISKKTFRSNSSILGQRKKNQRKSRNKKRAQERRASESETSEYENEGDLKDSGDANGNDNPNLNIKSDDETSETQSDVSESDDGMKNEKPDEMSLSRYNPHKRGGKKSARKSAATAKMAFTNNLMFDLDM